MLPEKQKEQVKKRIKAKVLKHWKKNLEEILNKPEERLELYVDTWKMREENKNFSAIPNAVILQLLIQTIGHWDEEHHKGIHIPEDQSIHTIGPR